MRKHGAEVIRHACAAVPGLACMVRVSSRAVHPRLKMMPHEGLVVVVPQHYDMRLVDELLFRHRGWIARAAARIGSAHAAMDGVSGVLLPQFMAFHCVGEKWTVHYQEHMGSGRVKVHEPQGGELVLSGETSDRELCRSVLRRWLQKRAGRALVPMLHELAVRHDFRFGKAAVRLQKSRWGSCSSSRAISLNAKLLFLPSGLSLSVMLHELCHTVHLNHSRSFRELLACHDPLWREHDHDLRMAWRYVPRWVDAEISDSVFLP